MEGTSRPNKRRRQAMALAKRRSETIIAATGGRRVLDMPEMDEEMLIAGGMPSVTAAGNDDEEIEEVEEG